MGNKQGNLRRAGISGAIFLLGFITLLAHGYHFVEEGELREILTGVIPPAIVSFSLLVVAVYLYRSDLPDAYLPRVLAWVFGGALGLASLGAALVLYQTAHGAELYDFWFVVVNWLATGGLVGFFIGYYNASLGEANDRLKEQRDELSRRENELSHKNDRLQRLAHIVSHDLRNPLNVATGHVTMARENEDVEYLDTVSNSLDRMEDIIEDTLSMVSAGQTISRGDRTRVRIGNVAEASWGCTESADATLVIDGDAAVTADRSRLRTLFENLFRNACDHCESGVIIRVGRLPSGDGFFVEDDGPGFPPDADVFEAGFTTHEDGTGLGLPIVEEVVTAHGWDIAATEGSDGGARFEITGVDCSPVADSRSLDKATAETD